MKRKLLAVLCAAGLMALAGTAAAQQIILKGEFGNFGGTMAPPGLYAGMFGDLGWADQLKDAQGNTIARTPELKQEIFGPLISYVSTFKLFGANYGAMVAAPFSNTRAEFPRLGVSASTGLAFSQLWVVPLELGWHFKDPLPLSPGGMDLTFHYAFYAPTGRYTAGAPNNTSLGMWVNEISLRATAFFDKDREWTGTASLFYDFNGKKQGQDWTTGNPFTYMWGLGHTYGAKDALFSGWFGLAGYAQWQVTDTTGIDAPLIARLNKSRVYAVGPEFATLQGALQVRYYWEFGARTAAQGQTLYVQFAMPIGK